MCLITVPYIYLSHTEFNYYCIIIFTYTYLIYIYIYIFQYKKSFLGKESAGSFDSLEFLHTSFKTFLLYNFLLVKINFKINNLLKKKKKKKKKHNIYIFYIQLNSFYFNKTHH